MTRARAATVGGAHGAAARTRAVAAASLGSALEWYDFYIYGVASALVFNQLFFPSVDPTTGTLAAFATFGLGFFARPIGGVVFSHYGDKIGRKAILVITLLLMGGATTLIGLLPTYASIGMWAPALLLLMRLLQGFGSGAELGGANTLVVEHSEPGRRGRNTGFIFVGVVVGLLASSGVFALISALTTEEQFLAWGWRIPFLLSIVLVGVGLYMRRNVSESPVFNDMREERSEARIPALEVFRVAPKSLFIVMGGRVAENGILYLYSVFLLSFIAGQLELPASVGTLGLMTACVVALVSIPFFASLSDRIGRRPVLLASTAFAAVSAFPLFWLVETGSAPLITLALVIGVAVAWGSMVGVQGVYFTELFPTRLRYSGYTIGREISSIFAGGLSPFIATALIAWSGGPSWPVAAYAVVMSAIGFVALCCGPETYRIDITK